MDLNKVSLIGNVANDPETRSLESGQSMARFRIATNYIWKDYKTKTKKETVEFHNIVAWGRLADIIGQYIKKGSKLYIEGRLQNRTWENKNGERKYMTEVVADEMIMLGHRAKPDASDEALAKEEPAAEELAVEDIA